ncbi:MAG: hypothetical protein HQK78_19730 [Desulfobacterales bacterium]|nr:hypothetical protein [Desulfobacterales bacterium]
MVKKLCKCNKVICGCIPAVRCNVNFSRLLAYDYRTLKNSTAIGFIDELYENFVYELLLSEYKSSDEFKFIIKGPYVKNNKINPITGFKYNNNCIYYVDQGETLAEFDALAISFDKIIFYEITRANAKKAPNLLRLDVERKTTLLKLIFDRKIISKIIAPPSSIINDYFPDVIQIDLPQFDFSIGKFHKRQSSLPSETNFIELDEFVYRRFSYFKTIELLYNNFTKKLDIILYYKKIKQEYAGVIKRLFIGRCNNKIHFVKIDHIKNTITFMSIYKIKHTYMLEDEDNETVKMLKTTRRTYKDIKYLDRIFIVLNSEEIKQLKQKLKRSV